MSAATRPLLVLIPGMQNTPAVWQPVAEQLADCAEIIIADVRSQASLASMAGNILAEVGGRRFAVAGFSMGGYVAFELFRRAARQLTGMAFISTSARADAQEAIASREKMLAIVQSDYARAVALTLHFAPHPSRVDDEVLQIALRAIFEGVSQQAMVQQLRIVMTRPESRPLLAEIALPALVVSGVDDIVISPDCSEEIAQAVAGATLVWLPECGHLSPVEQPAALAQAMRSWLGTVAISPHFTK